MKFFRKKEFLAFDDVMLVPAIKSTVLSRLETNISTKIGPMTLNIPIISSPMETITESAMAIKISELGGLGIIHRFMTQEEQLEELKKVVEAKQKTVPAIGVGEKEFERFKFLFDNLDSEIDMYAIDVANGYHSLVEESIDKIKKYAMKNRKKKVSLLAGNVATSEGFEFLANLGVDAIRVGIGSGSICKTRIQTGFGVPLLSSIDDCREVAEQYNVSLIADGGIRYGMDVAKSIAAGADAVMCGNILSGTKESPGEIFFDEENNFYYKIYRGMASKEVQIERRGGLKKGVCAEGVETKIKFKGCIEDVLDDYIGGLRSALTYNNSKDLKNFKETAMFTKITTSGLLESHAFGTKKE